MADNRSWLDICRVRLWHERYVWLTITTPLKYTKEAELYASDPIGKPLALALCREPG